MTSKTNIYKVGVSPIAEGRTRPKIRTGEADNETPVTMLRYDDMLDDMVPVNTRKVNQMFPSLSTRYNNDEQSEAPEIQSSSSPESHWRPVIPVGGPPSDIPMMPGGFGGGHHNNNINVPMRGQVVKPQGLFKQPAGQRHAPSYATRYNQRP